MENDKQKAKKLWHYLKIRDEHLLIRTQDKNDKTEKILIVTDEGSGKLHYAYVEIPPAGFRKWIEEYGQPFTLVQQRNEDGCFFVPDIERWVMDEEADY